MSIWTAYKRKPEWFLQRYRTALKNLFPQIDNKKRVDFVNPLDFCSDPTKYSTSGATSVKTKYAQNGYRLNDSKLVTALFRTPEQILELLEEDSKQINKAVPKREWKRVRNIISSDYQTYLKMQYISWHIEPSFKGSAFSTLWTDFIDLQPRMIDRIRRRGLSFPIDQSAFDVNISKSMVLIAIEEMRDYYTQTYPSLRKYFDKVLNALDGGIMVVGDQELQVQGGVMSGWRWTALIDTLVNIGQINTFRQVVLDFEGYDPVFELIAQGDDDDVEICSLSDADRLTALYQSCDFEVNPRKTFLSTTRDEFLRQSFFSQKVAGIPARVINSILWMNPVNSTPPVGTERLTEIVNIWSTLYSRGGSKSRVLKLMIQDLVGASKFSKKNIMKLLETPASLGGLGVFEKLSGEGKALKQKIVNRVGEVRNLVGLQQVDSYWQVKYNPIAQQIGSWRGDDHRVEMSLKNVKWCYKGSAKGALSSRVPIPRWRPQVPQTFRTNYFLLKFRKEKFKNFDFSQYLMDDDYKNVKNNSTGKVFLDWVTNGLPFKIPVIFGVNPNFVNKIHRYAYNKFFRAYLNSKRKDYDYLKMQAVRAELYTRELVYSSMESDKMFWGF
jgi:hypothetical protein